MCIKHNIIISKYIIKECVLNNIMYSRVTAELRFDVIYGGASKAIYIKYCYYYVAGLATFRMTLNGDVHNIILLL